MNQMYRILLRSLFCVFMMTLVFTSSAMASSATGTTFGFEKVLETISQSLTGPVATSLAVIALVFAGVMWMRSQPGQGINWTISILLGYTIAVTGSGILRALPISSALM